MRGSCRLQNISYLSFFLLAAKFVKAPCAAPAVNPTIHKLSSLVEERVNSLLQVKFPKRIALFKYVVWKLLQRILQIKPKSIAIRTARSKRPNYNSIAC